jgi:hypothetical protein
MMTCRSEHGSDGCHASHSIQRIEENLLGSLGEESSKAVLIPWAGLYEHRSYTDDSYFGKR